MTTAAHSRPRIGEPAPWFTAPMLGQASGADFDKAGGRHVLLLFFGSAANPASEAALRVAEAHADLLADGRAALLAVTVDRGDVANGRLKPLERPGIHVIVDADRQVSRLYGAVQPSAAGESFSPYWLLLDLMLRVTASFPLPAGAEAFAALRRQLGPPSAEGHAPALVIPDILDPDLADALIALHQQDGGAVSGVMRQVGGRTVEVREAHVKRRRDCFVEDPALKGRLADAITGRLVPMIARGFQYRPTEIERYIVSCYDSAEGAHFAPHRDNTTPATRHRRLAVTINLNDDYEGGDLRFPEFGTRTYRAPRLGAIVFSCSLLHEVTRMTRGQRYATLPFLYGGAPLGG